MMNEKECPECGEPLRSEWELVQDFKWWLCDNDDYRELD